MGKFKLIQDKFVNKRSNSTMESTNIIFIHVMINDDLHTLNGGRR